MKRTSTYYGMESLWEMFDKNKDVKTVTLFVDGIKERVRITRVFKRERDFRVQMGRANYAERLWWKKHGKYAKGQPTIVKLFPVKGRKK